MTTPSLASFFEEMRLLLSARKSPADVLAVLGPCPSGPERFALYPRLVARQRRDVIEALFPRVKAACESFRDGLWTELRDGYVDAHRPHAWEPNQYGQGFAAFLSEKRQREPGLPSSLEELADYAWVRYQCSVAERLDPDDGVGLNRTLFIRTYDHDVVGYHDRSESGAPVLQVCPLIICWSRTSHALFVTGAATAALVALGRRLGHDPTAGRVIPGLDEDAVRRAEEVLVSRGALAPR